MKKVLKAGGAALLMLSFMLSSFCYFFLDTMEAGYKLTAAEHVQNSKDLQVIMVPLHEFRENREDDELHVNGKLYDISSYVVEGNIVKVTVYHDKGEEDVQNEMSASFEQEHDLQSDHHNHIDKYKVHIPDDARILGPRMEITFSPANMPASEFAHLIQKAAAAGERSVIKPPPDLFI